MTTRLKTARQRNWKKYLNRNMSSGRYTMDCQVVTAVNAYYFLTGKTIKQDSKRYAGLCEVSGAVAGSAINIEKAYKRLGIKRKRGGQFLFDILGDRKFDAVLPCELSVWHKAYGFHSVLIVDYEVVTHSLRITNFAKATNEQGWIYEEDLQHYVKMQKERTVAPFETWYWWEFDLV